MKGLWGFLLLPWLASCDYLGHLSQKIEQINHVEKYAVSCTKENRELVSENNKLNFELQKLKSENHYLKLKLSENHRAPNEAPARLHEGERLAQRTPSSLAKRSPLPLQDPVVLNDLKEEDLLALADTAFAERDYAKAFANFELFLQKYPESTALNDELLFQVGIAAFKTANHSASLSYLAKVAQLYPDSKFHRAAKLWTALNYHELGRYNEFYQIVDEFRRKYQNTQEWNLLKTHYENFRAKYRDQAKAH